MTLCVRSAIVTVPVLGPPSLAATRKAIVALPLPLADDVIVIHSALLRAVHVHPVTVATVTLALAALAETVWLSGAMVNWQGAASCMTRTRLSLTTISPSRMAGAGFAPARNSTVPLPWPEVGERSVIQFTGVVTVQAHSGCAVTVTAPVPPPETMFEGAARESWHFGGVGPVVTVDVEESQPATIIATTVSADTSTDGHRRKRRASSAVRHDRSLECIEALQHSHCAVPLGA